MATLFYCLKHVSFLLPERNMNSLEPGSKVISVFLLLQLPSLFVFFFPTSLEKRNLPHLKHHLTMCVMCMSICSYTHICMHVSSFV
jgi:hypothetical protein